MPAQNYIDTFGFRRQFLVANFILYAESEMRKADNHIASLLCAQPVGHFLRCGNRVVVNDAFALIGLYQAFHFGTQPKYADFHSVAVQYNVRLHQPFKDGSGDIIVGAHHRELGHAEQTRHIIQPEVKLMVTDSHGVIAHEVHHLDFHLTLEKVVIRRTLRNVAAVKEQDIRIAGTKIFQKSGTAHHTAHTGIPVGSMRVNRFDTAMGITCVQNDQLFGLLCRCCQQYAEYQQAIYRYTFHRILFF